MFLTRRAVARKPGLLGGLATALGLGVGLAILAGPLPMAQADDDLTDPGVLIVPIATPESPGESAGTQMVPDGPGGPPPPSGPGTSFPVETVTVSAAPCNGEDTTSHGSVCYTYQIGKYEITQWQYCAFLNSVAHTGDPHYLYTSGMATPAFQGIMCGTNQGNPPTYAYTVYSNYASYPARYISGERAMRFCNWLHHGRPSAPEGPGVTEDGAYDLSAGASRLRQAVATWGLPTADEWYKAAFYAPQQCLICYNPYPTGGTMNQNMANYGHPTGSTVGVGSYASYASPWGTLNQGGNVDELLSPEFLSTGEIGISIWGGNYTSDVTALESTATPVSGSFTYAGTTNGFRVVSLLDTAAMTAATRTSGVAPLAVFFDAVDTAAPAWSSGVVQPPPTSEEKVVNSQPVNITGATVTWVSYATPVGSGTLHFNKATGAFTWAAPGDTAGAPVSFTADDEKTLTSLNGESVGLRVAFASLPPNSASDSIAIGSQLFPDYASYHYEWDFGDPSSGRWATDSKSRNRGVGYVNAHVFEHPGTYRVFLRITDNYGNTFDYHEDITVQAFSGTTYYVSATGLDSNDGLSPEAPFQTFTKAMSVSAGNTRVLFNRGDVFPTDDVTINDGTGPFLIGTYGTGDNPVIQYTGSYQALDLTYTGLEVSISDVDFTGSDPGSAGVILGTRDLVCRSHMQNFNIGIWDGNGEGWNDEDFVVDCRIENTNSYDIYNYGFRRTAILGSTFGDAGSTQVRIFAPKTLVGHNVFQGYALQDFLKLLGVRPVYGKTRFSIISDNLFQQPPDHLQMVDIGPENNVYTEGLDERIEDTVIERNTWDAGFGFDDGGIASDQGNRITIRNNVFINLERGIMQNDMVGEGWNS
jgi:formylglycine-generating enzyme required for sulfatase activity